MWKHSYPSKQKWKFLGQIRTRKVGSSFIKTQRAGTTCIWHLFSMHLKCVCRTLVWRHTLNIGSASLLADSSWHFGFRSGRFDFWEGWGGGEGGSGRLSKKILKKDTRPTPGLRQGQKKCPIRSISCSAFRLEKNYLPCLLVGKRILAQAKSSTEPPPPPPPEKEDKNRSSGPPFMQLDSLEEFPQHFISNRLCIQRSEK